jgi:1,4-alpha-glucan branching enzyme
MKRSVGKAGKEVRFELTVEPGSQVCVVGTFNNWDPAVNPMKDNPGSGHCLAITRLQPGRHEYKFIVNGEWRVDPNCAESVPNDQGSLNSVIAV